MTKWQFLLIFLKRVENDPFLGLKSELRILPVDEDFEILLEIYLY